MKRMFSLSYMLLVFVSFSFGETNAPKTINNLRQDIEQFLVEKKALVGVSVLGIEDNESLSINNDKHFSMQSVYKFHIALTALHEVDTGNLSLEDSIMLKESDLLPNTWSPLRETYLAGKKEITLAELINYTVALSDNNGSDILLRLIGGTEKVNEYIHGLGIIDVQITTDEENMHKESDLQFENWTTPEAATELLTLFYDGKVLSKQSTDFLWKVMVGTETGGGRIKGKLPSGTLVAHKTGTSAPPDESGVTVAINDIGIVTLPNNNHFVMSVFVANSKESYETNEKIIADITKFVWNYFTHKAN